MSLRCPHGSLGSAVAYGHLNIRILATRLPDRARVWIAWLGQCPQFSLRSFGPSLRF